MENLYSENVPDSTQQNIAIDSRKLKLPAKEWPILVRVFSVVFLGFFADIANGIVRFVKRYTTLISDSFKFLWNPNADVHTKANEATLHNTKETFEFILIITAITFFLIKQGAMESTQELKESYGDDLMQYGIEFFLFFVYAAVFFAVLVSLVLLGRLLRVFFKPIETRDVTDKVFINLNNIFFLITIIYSFIRKFDRYNRTDLDNIDSSWYVNWFIFYTIPLALLVFLFFIRLVMINKLTIGRTLAYCIVVPTITTMLLAFCGLLITAGFSGL